MNDITKPPEVTSYQEMYQKQIADLNTQLYKSYRKIRKLQKKLKRLKNGQN